MFDKQYRFTGSHAKKVSALTSVFDCFEDIYAYAAAKPNAQPYRNRTGGNLLFRPVALLPFVRAAVKVSAQFYLLEAVLGI
jgi:hypothetical protein